jgi:hypothetical protein
MSNSLSDSASLLHSLRAALRALGLSHTIIGNAVNAFTTLVALAVAK